MKHLLSMSIRAAGLLLLTSAIQAQDCRYVRHSALRGTYSFTGTAWQDMSVINPVLPKGYAPVSILGTFILSDYGEVTGWAFVNAGGMPLTAEFVDSQFNAPNADCSIPITLSMKINEFGGVIDGPHSYVGVIEGDGAAREIVFMMLGTGPGSHVELNHAKPISMKLDQTN